MKIKDKIYMDQNELAENGPINIVAFGDNNYSSDQTEAVN